MSAVGLSIEGWVPEGWEPASWVPERWVPTGWVPRGWSPKGGGPKGGGSPKGGPQEWGPDGVAARKKVERRRVGLKGGAINCCVFVFLSRPMFDLFFSLSRVLFELWPLVAAMDHPNCALGLHDRRKRKPVRKNTTRGIVNCKGEEEW